VFIVGFGASVLDRRRRLDWLRERVAAPFGVVSERKIPGFGLAFYSGGRA
jgi:hypothetical protein